MSASKNNVIPFKSKLDLTHTSDDELMQLAAANYKDAFSELVVRYQNQIRGFCTKWHGEKGDDLAQDAFVKLWNARKKYKSQNEFKAYLYSITLNVCRNAKRRDLRKPDGAELVSEKVSDGLASSQLDDILEKEHLKHIAEEIYKLSPKLKEAILLRYSHDLNYLQIEKLTGVKQETIRSRVLLAINKLKAALL